MSLPFCVPCPVAIGLWVALYQSLWVLSDIPGQSGSPAVLPGVFSQLPGSCLIGVSHFPYSGPEVLRSSFPGPSSSSHLGRDVSGPLSQR